MLDLTHLRLDDVQGVGTIELNLDPGKQAYVFIGANGVGKTKLLETIYKLLYVTHKENIIVERYSGLHSDYSQACVYDEETTEYYVELDYITPERDHFTKKYKLGGHNSIGYYSVFDVQPRNPVIFIETRDRGFFESPSITLDSNKLKLETKDSVKKWILEMAYASNPFQKERSKKENTIKSMFKLLSLIDDNYDPDFIEIDDHENIYIKINGKTREFSELSTGYSSLLKIVQIIWILDIYVLHDWHQSFLVNSIEKSIYF